MEHIQTPIGIKPVLIENALHWRHATKVFDKTRTVPDDKFDVLLETLRLSPSSINLQPWKFVVVKNRTIRKQLRALAMDQPQVTDASHLLLLCSLETADSVYFDRLISLEKQARDGDSALEGFRPVAMSYIEAKSKEELQEWLAEQVYIALGFLLFSCAMMHIDACPIEGFDHEKVDKLLNLHKHGIESRVMVPIGYRPEKDEYSQQPKIRWPKEELVITL